MTHGSSVTTRVQSVESPVARDLGRGAQREHLGVRGGVARELAFVASRGDDSARRHRRRSRRPARRALRAPAPPRRARGCIHSRCDRQAPRAAPSARHPRTRLEPMRVHVADHPLITHKLTVLRDVNTPSPMFRALVEELMTLLAYEGTRGVRVEPVDIVTPVRRRPACASPSPSRSSCRSCARASACSRAWSSSCRAPRSASSAWPATR